MVAIADPLMVATEGKPDPGTQKPVIQRRSTRKKKAVAVSAKRTTKKITKALSKFRYSGTRTPLRGLPPKGSRLYDTDATLLRIQRTPRGRYGMLFSTIGSRNTFTVLDAKNAFARLLKVKKVKNHPGAANTVTYWIRDMIERNILTVSRAPKGVGV